MWSEIYFHIIYSLSHFEKTYTLNGYFGFSFPNCLVEEYVKYIWYVQKNSLITLYRTMFSYILTIPHNFK
jgi:hypothetical protein